MVVQVGAAGAGADAALLAAPDLNFLVVAGQQHGRHGASLPHLGAGVLRVFQKPVPVAFVLIAFFLRQHAGLQTQHTVRHHKACQLAAGQHIIPDGDFLIPEGVDHTLVDALVMPANQRYSVILCQFTRLGFVIGRTGGGQKHNVRLSPALLPALRLHGAQAVGDGLGIQHHTASAAVGVVVGLLLLI